MKELEKTKWAKKFKSLNPSSYERALRFASQNPLNVNIYHNDEAGALQYSIAVMIDGEDTFWMDSKKSYKKAKKLCDKMGWEVEH